MTLAGYADWELPSIDVLEDMLEKKDLFDQYKMVGRDSIYWSSTSYGFHNFNAWSVHFYSSDVDGLGSKRHSYNVRCVRSG